MRLRLPAVLILAFALLVATQGALLHPLAHAGERAHASLAGEAEPGGHEGHQACDLCVAFSALHLTPAGGAALVSPARPDVRRVVERYWPSVPRSPPAFFSQAPPALS